MTIGMKLPPVGERLVLNKWYIGIEILKCPRDMERVLKPYFFIYCIKVLDYGEPDRMYGGEKRKGYFKSIVFPWGISITIIR